MVVDSLYRTVTGIFLCRADKRIVSASAPLPLISATVEVDAPMFQNVGADGAVRPVGYTYALGSRSVGAGLCPARLSLRHGFAVTRRIVKQVQHF